MSPIYEYICEKDGATIEIIRPMSQADAPVDDPEGKGRKFIRKQSAIAAVRPKASAPSSQAGGGHVHSAACGCGRPHGMCGAP